MSPLTFYSIFSRVYNYINQIKLCSLDMHTEKRIVWSCRIQSDVSQGAFCTYLILVSHFKKLNDIPSSTEDKHKVLVLLVQTTSLH